MTKREQVIDMKRSIRDVTQGIERHKPTVDIFSL